MLGLRKGEHEQYIFLWAPGGWNEGHGMHAHCEEEEDSASNQQSCGQR